MLRSRTILEIGKKDAAPYFGFHFALAFEIRFRRGANDPKIVVAKTATLDLCSYSLAVFGPCASIWRDDNRSLARRQNFPGEVALSL